MRRASLVVQRLRICFAMQGILVFSLIREDPTCLGQLVHVPQLLKPANLELLIHNRRGYFNKKSTYCKQRVALAHPNYRKPMPNNKDPAQPKNNKN